MCTRSQGDLWIRLIHHHESPDEPMRMAAFAALHSYFCAQCVQWTASGEADLAVRKFYGDALEMVESVFGFTPRFSTGSSAECARKLTALIERHVVEVDEEADDERRE